MRARKSPLHKVDRLPQRRAKFAPLAADLLELYGAQPWQRQQDGMDELVSCILSQNTNDDNRDRAFACLKRAYADWAAVHRADTQGLEDVIRPAGLAKQKAPNIQAALQAIHDHAGSYNIDFLDDMRLDDAKAWLMSLRGVGPKTAAIVLCFAYNRPAFPVDTHIHRVSKRLGLLPEKLSANDAHPVMEAIVPPSETYQFHLHLIFHGRATCRARKPDCQRCRIRRHCEAYDLGKVG